MREETNTGKGLRFDGTISLGTVIHIVVLVAAMFTAWSQLDSRLTRIEATIQPVVRWWERQVGVEDPAPPLREPLPSRAGKR